MKYKFSLIAFVTCILSNAQIIINKKDKNDKTDNPKYTLDINGSMRIGNAPAQTPETVPLAWNPDTKQVILGRGGENATERKYYVRRYKIKMESNRTLNASNVRLGINPERYTAVLIASNLVTDEFSYDDPGRGGAIVSAVLEHPVTGERKIAKIKGSTFEAGSGGFGIGLIMPQLDVTSNGRDYLFSADFSGTEGAQNRKYVWIIDVLISNKF